MLPDHAAAERQAVLFNWGISAVRSCCCWLWQCTTLADNCIASGGAEVRDSMWHTQNFTLINNQP
jgi:hypothetical protein